MAFLSGPINSLDDFQVEYAGLLMGPGTCYELPPTWAFLDLPPVKSMETSRPWADGSFAGPDFADAATWTVPVGVGPAEDGTVSFTDALVAFMNACTIQPTSQPLWVKLPGLPVRGLAARTMQRSVPIDLGFGQYTAAAVQWRASKPVWQSAPRSISFTSSANTVAALHFPLFADWAGDTAAVLDYNIVAATSTSNALANGGNAPAWPVVTITGPCSTVRIDLDGHAVTYVGQLNDSDVLTIDYATGRAQLVTAGSAPTDRTYLLTGRDFSPVTGASTVTVTADGGTATVTTADMWR